MSYTSTLPSLLLIGCGRFGQHYARILSQWHQKKRVQFAGIVVQSEASQKKLQKNTSFPVYTELTSSLLESVSGVMIVTPVASHYELIKQCLPYGHVLVEKPIVETKKDLIKIQNLEHTSPHIIMVNHILRYDKTMIELKHILEKNPDSLSAISSTFLNPLEGYKGQNPVTEFLHAFDCVHFTLNLLPTQSSTIHDKQKALVNLTYPPHINGSFTLGWDETPPIRNLSFTFSSPNQENYIICCNLKTQTITKETPSTTKLLYNSSDESSPLERMLTDFCKLIKGDDLPYTTVDIAAGVTLASFNA